MTRSMKHIFAGLGVATLLASSNRGFGEPSATNTLVPGLRYFAETRTQPPTRLFIAEVDLTNPKLRLRVAAGGADPDGPGPWQTTLQRPTQIAAREGMALVVNGDFFRARGVKDAEGTNSAYRAEVWSAVSGPAVSGGHAWSVSPSARPCLVVDRKGRVAIKSISQPGRDDWEVISGNTLLITNGVAVPHESQTRHPRTAIGIDAKHTRLVILVVDGRKPGVAIGMSYAELGAEMLRLGCRCALNLDGGGSSVMAVCNPDRKSFRILNQPTDGRERPVANALGVVVVP